MWYLLSSVVLDFQSHCLQMLVQVSSIDTLRQDVCLSLPGLWSTVSHVWKPALPGSRSIQPPSDGFDHNAFDKSPMQLNCPPEDKETGTCVVLLQYQVCCPKCTNVPFVIRRVSGQPDQSVSDLTRIHRGNCSSKTPCQGFCLPEGTLHISSVCIVSQCLLQLLSLRIECLDGPRPENPTALQHCGKQLLRSLAILTRCPE